MATSSRLQKLMLRFSSNSLLWFFFMIRYFASSSSIPFSFEGVGFIGLGNMGSHMAINLANNGYKVTVYDINHSALKRFSEMGMTTKETPLDVAESSDVVITMLPSPSHVGGPEVAYEAAKPLFLLMGKNSVYCGRSGNGFAAKICNNLVAAVSMLGVSKAFVLGQNLCISAATLTEIVNSSSAARCWSSDTYNPVHEVMPVLPSSRNYDGGFSSKLMAKDLGLAIEAAKEVNIVKTEAPIPVCRIEKRRTCLD